MSKKTIREPVQSRSIDKKNKIIKTAYDVFSKEGYYKTNTADIAKKAGVSTGIVYGYFKDKSDILLYVIDIYIHNVATPCMEYVKNLKAPINIHDCIYDLIELTTRIHKENANLHNILHSLSVSNAVVRQKFISLEDHITKNASQTLKELGVKVPDLTEKVHIIMNSIQTFSHEFVYDRHKYIDYEQMKKNVADMSIGLLIE